MLKPRENEPIFDEVFERIPEGTTTGKRGYLLTKKRDQVTITDCRGAFCATIDNRTKECVPLQGVLNYPLDTPEGRLPARSSLGWFESFLAGEFNL